MSLTDSVRSAVAWRSGSQIVAQIITWSVTLAVVRILDPGDYGLFAMGQVIITFLSFLNGYGFASALIQRETIDRQMVRQTFGMLILVNFALAAIQFFADDVVEAFLRYTDTELGETSEDGNFTVIEAECLAACGFPTCVQINSRYYENVTPSEVPKIVEHLKAQTDGDS